MKQFIIQLVKMGEMGSSVEEEHEQEMQTSQYPQENDKVGKIFHKITNKIRI